MAIIRFVLGRIILFLNWLFSPRAISRSPEDQTRVDQRAASMMLYELEACPFCVRVRRHLKRLAIPIEIRDVARDPAAFDELLKGGGQDQVPCLRIEKEDGSVEWMYESAAIIDYLKRAFA
jgi:glutaredoxin